MQQAYTRLTGDSIVTGSLDLLSSVEHEEVRRIKNLPSWVPDYSTLEHNDSFAKGYNAATKVSSSASYNSSSGELTISAMMVDTIKMVLNYDADLSAGTFMLKAFFMAAAYIRSNDAYHWLSLLANDQSEAGLDAFWQTMIGDRSSSDSSPAREEFRDHFAAYISRVLAKLLFSTSEEAWMRILAIPQSETLLTKGDQELFFQIALDKITDNRFFVTTGDRIGLATKNIQIGDEIALIDGGSPIYIVRACEGHYRFVGDGYVHDLMNGEGLISATDGFKNIVLK